MALYSSRLQNNEPLNFDLLPADDQSKEKLSQDKSEQIILEDRIVEPKAASAEASHSQMNEQEEALTDGTDAQKGMQAKDPNKQSV